MTLTPAQRDILRRMAAGDVPYFALNWYWIRARERIDGDDLLVLTGMRLISVREDVSTLALTLTNAGWEAAKGE